MRTAATIEITQAGTVSWPAGPLAAIQVPR